MSALLKRTVVTAAGSAVMALGMGSAAQAIGLNISAQTNGIDSGYDRVIGATYGANTFDGVGNQFFSVQFNDFQDPAAASTSAFIRSITLQLNANGDSNASFDNQTLMMPAPPQVGRTNGIDSNNIQFGPVGRNGFLSDGSLAIFPELTVSFENEDFNVGDSFTWGLDTNGVGDDSIPALAILNDFFNTDMTLDEDTGADFGRAGVKFLAEVVYGEKVETFESIFSVTGLYRSQANIISQMDPFNATSAAPFPAASGGNPAAVPTPALLPGLLGFGVSLMKKRRRYA